MKKLLVIVAAAAGAALVVQRKVKADQATKDLWAQAADQPERR